MSTTLVESTGSTKATSTSESSSESTLEATSEARLESWLEASSAHTAHTEATSHTSSHATSETLTLESVLPCQLVVRRGGVNELTSRTSKMLPNQSKPLNISVLSAQAHERKFAAAHQ